MNKLTWEQIQKIRVAQLGDRSRDKTSYLIPKLNKESIENLVVGECYLIKLAKYIINPPDGFNLHDNWNDGKIPNCLYYNCQIVKMTGKMIFITGAGYDYENDSDLCDFWSGWLPRSSIEVIKKIV